MEEFSLSDLIVPLRRSWALIIGIALPLTALAILYTYFFVPTTWQASTSIVFEERADAGLSMLRQFAIADAVGGGGGRGEFLEFLVSSRSVRSRVVDRLDLVEKLGVNHRIHAIQQLGDATRVRLPATGVLVLWVTWTDGPRSEVAADAREPAEMVARIAQAMIESLEEEVSHNAYTEAARRVHMLEEQLQRANLELLQAEDRLVEYATSEGLISPSGQGSAVVSELQALQKREAELQAELDGVLSRERTARQRLSDQERMVVTSMSEGRDPAIDQLRQRIIDLQQRIAEQREVQGKSEAHPDVASLMSELESARAQLADLLESELHVDRRTYSVDASYSSLVAEALASSLEAAGVSASVEAVRGLRRATIEQIGQFPAKSTQYTRLQREVEIKSKTVASLTESYEMARVAEATSTTSFSVIDEPIAPLVATGPALKRTAVLAFIGSLLFSFLVAFWRQGRSEAASAQEPEAAAEEV